MTEDQIQAEFWKYCWNTHKHARRHMWSVPNKAIGLIASTKDQIHMNTLKATGLLEGVWDLHLFWKGILHIFETKTESGQLTVDRIDKKGKKHFGQKEWGELMVSHGAVSHIYRSPEEGIAIFESIVLT